MPRAELLTNCRGAGRFWLYLMVFAFSSTLTGWQPAAKSLRAQPAPQTAGGDGAIDRWLRSVPQHHVAPASFLDITPGRTRRDELQAWLANTSGEKPDLNADRWKVTVAPFKSVEIVFRQGIVSQVSVEFPERKPFEEVRDELRLARFVLVANDSQPGTASWLVPERGMRLRLEGETEPLLVRGIDLYEPRAEDFVLRAWRNETLRIAEALADLEYALQQDPADKWALLGLARRWELVGYPEQAAARLAASGSPSQLVRFEQARLLAISGYDSQATALLDQASVSEDTAPLLKSLYALAKAEALARTPANAAQQAALAEYAAAVEWSQKALAGSQLLERYLLRDILLAAYTGAARVIAAGPFRNRAESVTRWLQPADQMLAHTQHAGDAWLTGRGRLWEARLGCFSALKDPAVEIPSEIQIQQWVDLLLAQGEDAFGERSAKTWGGRIWLRAAEAALANGDIERASRAAQQAALLLADTTQKLPPYPHGETWLGQTYYLLGAIEAIGRRNHAAALRWYDRALPLLEEPAVRIVGIRLVANQWVSIGISYWETGDQPAGLRYTQKGWQMLEAAIRDGKCPAEAARVACQNLAYMYKTLGDADNAQRMAELARTLASGSTPAPMPATPMR